MADGQAQAHGRSANRPSEIPKAGWWEILKRVKDNIGSYEINLVSAGIAFNEFLALFPAIIAAISVYGLMADPATVERQVGQLGGFLPADVQAILFEQLNSVATASGGALGWALILSILLALWAATRGIKGLMAGLNIVYGEEESRGFFAYNLTALGMTLAAIIFGIIALGLIAAMPALSQFLPFGDLGRTIAMWLRWPVLAVFVVVGFAFIYRYGPSRERPKWRWVSWGALIGAVLWLIGSALFSLYVSRFGDFNETYGSMAAVAVALLWFQLTAFATLLGALVDAELEQQTGRDTTSGQAQPMGQRGARVADTPPPKRSQGGRR